MSDYNTRLFSSGGIRQWYHLARFKWVEATCRDGRVNVGSVLELGCFDGRLLSHLPAPARYVGIDGNWEGGLDLAKQRFRGDDSKTFIESTTPDTLAPFPDRSFDAFFSLETIEHINPALLDTYLQQIARVVAGDVLITVPNEKGPLLLVKQIAKKLIGSQSEPYTGAELFFAAIGRMDRVARQEHKGFDYATLVQQIARRLEIVSVVGLPFKALPPILNLTVAIHARSQGKKGTP